MNSPFKLKQQVLLALAAVQLCAPFAAHATVYEFKKLTPTLVVSGTSGSVEPTTPATPAAPVIPPTAPLAALSATSLSFGSVNVGQTATAQSVLLANTGDASLTLTTAPTVSGSAFSATSNCGASLAPSASCSTSVLFAPGSVGALTGSLSFASNAAGSPSVVSLTGTGTPTPTFAMTQTLVDFGKAATGSVPAYRRVIVTNTGTVALVSPVVRGSGSGFMAHYNCSGTLAPAATCYFDFEFDPLAVQAYVGGVTLAYTGTATQSIVINGSGVASPTVTASSLALTSTATGVAAPSQTVTVNNTSDYSLTVSAVALSGTNAADFSASGCATPVAAGSSCTLTVGYTSSGTTAEAATLTLTHNGTGGSSVIALTGSNSQTTDPNFANVALLMHMDGAQNSTSFPDVKGHVVTRTGAPSVQLTAKFGQSAYLSSSSALNIANTDLNLSGNFTVEFWANPSNWNSANTTFLLSAASGGLQVGKVGSGATFGLAALGQSWIISDVPLPATSVWTHIAVVRSGTATNNVTIYVNGVAASRATNNSAFTVGSLGVGGYGYTGYIDELRITQGVARYTANFTVPSTPFLNQ